MKKYCASIGIALAAFISLEGCVGSAATDDVDSVEQFTFMGDLGVGLGNPVTTNNTTGRTNDYQPTCASSSAPDASYTWTAPSSGAYTFSTAGSSFDTILEIRQFNTGVSLGCNDDSNGTLQSTVSVNLAGGQTVLVIVDGFSTSNGPFQLNITASNAIPTSGLHLWLRADAGITLNGSQVSGWADQSGNGRNGSMPNTNAARQPLFVSNGLNGRPVLRFNGGQSLSLSPVSQPTLFSVFVVGKNSLASESFSMILGPGGNSPNNQLRWDNGSSALFVTQNAGTIITSPMDNTRVPHALSARYDGSTISWYRDGTFKSSSNFSTSSPWTIASVGSWYSSFFMTGDLAEVIIYDRAVSESERLSVNSYLRGKYGLP